MHLCRNLIYIYILMTVCASKQRRNILIKSWNSHKAGNAQISTSKYVTSIITSIQNGQNLWFGPLSMSMPVKHRLINTHIGPFLLSYILLQHVHQVLKNVFTLTYSTHHFVFIHS